MEFTIAGGADLGLLASVGAFTALYLANRSRPARARLLPIIALGLIPRCAALGVATSYRLVARLATLFLVAAVSSPLCFGLRLAAVRAIHRVLRTFVGLGLFALVAVWNPTGIVRALILAVVQFSVELVVIRTYGLALVLFTPLAFTIARVVLPVAFATRHLRHESERA